MNPRLEVLILGGLGTFLIFLNGVVYLVLGATFTAPIQFTTDAITVGLANILLTILLAALLWWYSDSPDPDDQGLSATLIVVVSAFTLWVGGGYMRVRLSQDSLEERYVGTCWPITNCPAEPAYQSFHGIGGSLVNRKGRRIEGRDRRRPVGSHPKQFLNRTHMEGGMTWDSFSRSRPAH